MQVIDRVQSRILHTMGVSEIDALCIFSVALPSARRDMPMLGVLHRAALGRPPPHTHNLGVLFPVTVEPAAYHARSARRRRPRQLRHPFPHSVLDATSFSPGGPGPDLQRSAASVRGHRFSICLPSQPPARPVHDGHVGSPRLASYLSSIRLAFHERLSR